MKFELVINLKTAQVLGITIPLSAPDPGGRGDQVAARAGARRGLVNEGTGLKEWAYPSAAHRALPAEPGSGADGPHDRLFPMRVSVACGPPLTAGVRLHVDSREPLSEGIGQREGIMRKKLRAVFVVIACAILAPIPPAGAQQTGNMPRIGFLGPGAPPDPGFLRPRVQ